MKARVRGHGFSDWFDRFHDERPELFALQPDGSRSGFPGGGRAKLCESNPELWQQWLRDVEATLERHPFRNAFSAAANDSWRSGHCICEGCRAWDPPEGQPVTFHWRGLTQVGVALSDRQVTFANRLTERLEERFPDRGLKVVILAYGLSPPAPVEAVAGDGVIVGMVHNFFQRHETSHSEVHFGRRGLASDHRDSYKAWTAMAKHHVWRPNTGNPARFKQGGPVDLQQAIEDFRLVGERGSIGIMMDTVMMYWATQGPLYYLMAQLAWDPALDGREVLTDYYKRGFGPAAAEIDAYWTLLETTRREIVQQGVPWRQAFAPEVFARACALLRSAAAKVEGERDVYARRIAYVRAGLDFLRLTTENLALDFEDDEAFAQAKANWAEIDRISRAYPLALNVGHVQRNPRENFRNVYPHRD